MQLFYTGAASADQAQPQPILSLGGYKSSSLIPNGGLHTLFPSITKDNVSHNESSTRMIVLKNTTGSTVNNLNIWTETNQYSTLEIAAVTPAFDPSSNQLYFESISDEKDIPFQAVLSLYDGQSSPLIITALNNNDYIGIWICRRLDLSKFSNGEKNIGDMQTDCATVLAELESQTQSSEDTYKVHFSW